MIEFKNKIENEIKNDYEKKLLKSRKRYLMEKKQGINDYTIDEWDQFEIERERYKIEKYKNKESKMAKFRTVVRLSKNYNVVEVEASELDTPKEAEDMAVYLQAQAVNMLNQIPDDGYGNGKAQSKPKGKPKQYTNNNYPPKTQQPKYTNSSYTANDISWNGQFGSPKQVNMFVKGLNDGKLDINDVNNIQDYASMQSYIKNVIFAK